MPVVGHQAVGKQLHAGDAGQRLREDAFEGEVVAVAVENRTAADTTIEDVKDHAAGGVPRSTRHAHEASGRRGGVSKCTGDENGS